MAMQDKVVTAMKSPLEKHAARVYTRGAFKRFKEQFVWSVSYDIRPSSQENHFLVIHMGDDKDSWGRREYDVEAIVGEQEFSCVCKLFEHLGILCRHILRVSNKSIGILNSSANIFPHMAVVGNINLCVGDGAIWSQGDTRKVC